MDEHHGRVVQSGDRDVTTKAVETNEPTWSRREVATALLGAFGVVSLAGCESDAAFGGEPGDSLDGLDSVANAVTGTTMIWVDAIGSATSPLGLRGITGNGSNPQCALAHGFWAKGDGGGGIFLWITPSSPPIDDGGTIIVPGGQASGCWRRVFSGPRSVRWYGATGNGLVPDAPAIQAAINAANGESEEIIIPHGVYRMGTTTIAITQSEMKISGTGRARLSWEAAHTEAGITITGDRVAIENIWLYKPFRDVPNPSSTNSGIWASGEDSRLRDVRVMSAGGTGNYAGWYAAIRYGGVKWWTHAAHDCSFFGNAYGVFAATVNALVLDRCLISADEVGFPGASIYIGAGAGNAIVNCDIEGKSYYGICLYSDSNNPDVGCNEGCTITGNYMENQTNNHITVAGYNGTWMNKGIVIQGNLFNGQNRTPHGVVLRNTERLYRQGE
jgi:hypothetical protein